MSNRAFFHVKCYRQALDDPCAERWKPVLPQLACHLARQGVFSLSPAQEEQLARISAATLYRLLSHWPRDKPRPPSCSPRDAHPWRQDVLMLRLPYDLREPGHLKVDLVHLIWEASCLLSASGYNGDGR